MVKKEIYPKTKRLNCEGESIYVTEKLDGSNLAFFKLNGELYFAQRNNIIAYSEYNAEGFDKQKLYKGLAGWLDINGANLKEELHEGSAICGEWLGMGQIKYDVGDFEHRWYMFAKANVSEDFSLSNLMYDHNLFIYPFISEAIPNYFGVVPRVTELKVLPNAAHLDSLYDKYTEKVGRHVEGFVLNYNNYINKYVRMKNGKLKDHFDYSEGGK